MVSMGSTVGESNLLFQVIYSNNWMAKIMSNKLKDFELAHLCYKTVSTLFVVDFVILYFYPLKIVSLFVYRSPLTKFSFIWRISHCYLLALVSAASFPYSSSPFQVNNTFNRLFCINLKTHFFDRDLRIDKQI